MNALEIGQSSDNVDLKYSTLDLPALTLKIQALEQYKSNYECLVIALRTINDQVGQEIHQHELERHEFRCKVDALEEQNGQLSLSMTEARAKIKCQAERIQTDRQVLQDMHDQYLELEKQSDERTTRHEAEKEKMTRQTKTITSAFERDLKQAEFRVQTLQAECLLLTEHKATLESTVRKQKKYGLESKRTCEVLQRHLEAAKGEIHDLCEVVQSHVMEAHDIEHCAGILRTQVESLTDQVQVKERSCKRLEDELGHVNEHVQDLEKALVDREEEKQALVRELENVRAKLNSTEDHVLQFGQGLEKLEGLVDLTKSQKKYRGDRHQASYEKTIALVESSLEQTQDQLREVQDQVLGSHHDRLEVETEQARKEVEMLSNQVADMHLELQQYRDASSLPLVDSVSIKSMLSRQSLYQDRRALKQTIQEQIDQTMKGLDEKDNTRRSRSRIPRGTSRRRSKT